MKPRPPDDYPDDYPDETCAACGKQGCSSLKVWIGGWLKLCATCREERWERREAAELEWLREKQEGRKT